MLRVIGKHRDAVNRIDSRPVPFRRYRFNAARRVGRSAAAARSMGFWNAQYGFAPTARRFYGTVTLVASSRTEAVHEKPPDR